MGLLLFWHGLPLAPTVPELEFSLGLAGLEVPLSHCDCTLSVSQAHTGLEMRTVGGSLKRDLLACKRQWDLHYTWLPGLRRNVYDNGMGRDDLLALFYATAGWPDKTLVFRVPTMSGANEEVTVQFGAASWRESLVSRGGALGSVYDLAFSLVEVTDVRTRAAPGIPALWYLAGALHEPEHAIAVYEPANAASLAESYINRVNPGVYNAHLGVAPALAAGRGWVFDGVNDYLLTGIPMAGNEYTVVCRYANFDPGSGVFRALFGYWESADTFLVRLHSVDEHLYFASAGYGALSPTHAPASGVVALTIDGGYLNGVLDTPFAGLITGTNAGTELAIGGEIAGGVMRYYCPTDITHLAVYDTKLSALQIAAISAAVAAL